MNMSIQPGSTRKEIRQVVFNKLSESLAEFKPEKKEKKFARNLIKATKLFADDYARSLKKAKKSKPRN